jgi:CshA-type fibril repeat protein
VLSNDSDLDGDSLTVSAATSSNGTVTINGDGTLNYVPNDDFNGTDTITYTISDGNGGTATATVTVTVDGVNDVPVAVNDTATVSEDSSNIINVLVNDTDIDGDSLTVSAATSSNGTVTINADGTLNYIPNADFNGTDTITYTISDGNGGTATATVTITVSSVNDAPVAVNDAATVSEDSSSNTLSVLSNDSDLDGDSLTVSAAISSNGSVTINGDGTLNYSPNVDFNGTDTISYSISDGNGGTATATVNVTVVAVNDVPIAVDDTTTVSEDSNSNTINVLDNDTDIDGDSLTVSAATSSNGTVTINADGTLNYIPNADFNGTDTITYTISDGNGGTATATVNVTVDAVNDVPIAVDDTAMVSEDSNNNTINVLDNDTDIDGDSLTVSAATSSNGTVTINADGSVNYIPNADFNGTDTITYTVRDGNGGTATATVTITVSPVNDAPVAEDDFTIVEQGVVVEVNVLGNDIDPDGDILTVTQATSAFGTVVINADNTITFEPNEGFVGAAVINYSISDGNGGFDTAQVDIVVEEAPVPVNNPPVAVNDSMTVFNYDPVQISVLDNDSDPDGHSISVQIASTDFGTVEVMGNTVIFTPIDGFTGDVVIGYSIIDELGATATASVVIFIDIEGPVIVLPADLCGEFNVEATGLYTRVNLGEASAVDRFGNPLPVSLINGEPLYPPGLNEAYWQATDAEGNSTVKAQKVCVNPLISINRDQTVPEGEAVKVGIFLNGIAPIYPLVVQYSVSGSANGDDHNLVNGEMTFASGTEVYIDFTTTVDSLIEINEDIVIDLIGNINMGNKHQHITTISEGNIAPQVSLKVVQAQQERLVVSQQDGLVTVHADIYDANIGDSFSIEWTNPDNMLVNISEQSENFVFVTSELKAGLYQITIMTVDSGEPQLSDSASVYIEVVAQLAELSAELDSDGDLIPDNIEGYKDSDGDRVADYLDRIDECNVLSQTVEVQDGYLIEGEPRICLRRGYFTVGGESGGAEITLGDINSDTGDQLVEDVSALNVGGIFDYIAYGMPEEGSEFTIVMPQIKPIPQNAVYRKLFPSTGWGNFVENDNNSLWSTVGEPGYCPPPNPDKQDPDNVWILGLTQKDWCVQMIIEDGGINDDDGEVNGNIVDLGGVSILTNNNHLPVAVDDYRTMALNGELFIDALLNDTDEDGDALILTSAIANFGSVEIVDNQLLYRSLAGYGGMVTIDYGVEDENGASDHGIVTIKFIINNPPVAQNDSASTNDRAPISIIVLGNDSDIDGDILTIVSATVDNGSVTINQDNTLTYTPDSGFSGIATISYTVDDGQGAQAIAQVSVSVEAHERVIVNNKSKGGSMGLMIVALSGLLFYRLRRQRTVSKKRLVQVATSFAIAVSMNLAASETQWFVTGSIGQSQAKALFTLPANTQLISRTWDDRDTSYSIGGGLRYVDFSFILSYKQLGEATASYTGDVLNVEQFHQALADEAPKLAEGFSLKSEYTFWQGETLSASIGLGLIAWDSEYSSVLGDSVITKDQSDTNLFYTAALAYKLTEKTQLSVQATRYNLLMNDVNNLALALRYHF